EATGRLAVRHKAGSPGRTRTDMPSRAEDFKSERVDASGFGSSSSREFLIDAPDEARPIATPAADSGLPAAASPPPRAAALEALPRSAAAAAAAGDMVTAHILHESAGRLLGAPQGEGAEVVSLDAERRRRER